MSNAKTTNNRPQLSEREKLARDLFIQLAVSPVTTGRDKRHIAGTAFDLADAFLEEQEARKK